MDIRKSLEIAKMTVDLIKQQFRDVGWTEADIDIALGWFYQITIILQLNGIPIRSTKMPEVFRAIANALDIIIAEEDKDDKSK